MDALRMACTTYRVPLDVALLGMLTIAMARADKVDVIELTLYTPMRDGLSDAAGVGLFADWRDLSIGVDFEMATTLGTILQISHKIQQRQWSVYNALRKPERTVINIQPLDFEKRSGFMHLGENMWHGGDQIGRPEGRTSEMAWVHQPANFVIEQQDEDTWWVLASAAHEGRPEPWMRSWVVAFRQAFEAFLFDPVSCVHRDQLPPDSKVLAGFKAEAKKAGYLW